MELPGEDRGADPSPRPGMKERENNNNKNNNNKHISMERFGPDFRSNT